MSEHVVSGRAAPGPRARPACCPRPPSGSTPRPEIGPDEVRISVERLNLDAASFRQLATKHGGDGAAVRAEVLEIIASRGKMQNPVTGSGGMLIGTVDEVGPGVAARACKVGDRVATLVSLTLTPLAITDGLAGWDGRSEQVPAAGHAILFARSIAAVLPDDLDPELALAVLDVCGAPALTDRVVRRYGRDPAARADRGRARRGRQVGLAVAGRGPAGRRPYRRGRPDRRPSATGCARPAWPTTSRSPTPATRSRWPTAVTGRARAGRPT